MSVYPSPSLSLLFPLFSYLRVADLKGLGSIAINNRADLLLFDKDLTLTATMVAGNTVWKK